jgi:hypothetical protein
VVAPEVQAPLVATTILEEDDIVFSLNHLCMEESRNGFISISTFAWMNAEWMNRMMNAE